MPTLAQARRDYDRSRRDPIAKAFYNSAAWIRCRAGKLKSCPLCEWCRAVDVLVAATMVHHTVAVADSQDGWLDHDNLVSLCASCHSRYEAGLGG